MTAAQLQLKRGADAAFKTVGMSKARSYVDHTPLAAPGVPEERQHQFAALKNDVVIGQPSPILRGSSARNARRRAGRRAVRRPGARARRAFRPCGGGAGSPDLFFRWQSRRFAL